MAEEDYQGGCLCGAIRYRFSEPIQFVCQCACKDCQKATGTGHTTIIGILRDQLALEGVPETYTCSGDTGGRGDAAFLRHVWRQALHVGERLPGDTIMIQAGSLDDPNRVSPQSVIYAKDACNWDRFDPDLPKFEAMQPAPPPQRD